MFIFTNPRTASPVCVELLGHQPEKRHIHYPIDERRVVPVRVADLLSTAMRITPVDASALIRQRFSKEWGLTLYRCGRWMDWCRSLWDVRIG